MGVAWLVQNFAPEAKGHGVPEVMDAINYESGKIRPVVAAVKSLASALSIGSGGSVGREGPIIQIGAAFGSTLGQILPMPTAQRITLIAAGAGAGIAATFNTPIGGVLFAVELMLPAISAATLLPVALATVIATYIGRWSFGMYPSFDVPALWPPNFELQTLYIAPVIIVAGILLGLLAALFVRSIYWFEDRFDSLPGNYYTRHMLGMFGVGLMMYLLMQTTGHYYIQGVGYATIDDVLRDVLNEPGLLLLLIGAKLLATGLTLGSGASGGVVLAPIIFGCNGRWFDGVADRQNCAELGNRAAGNGGDRYGDHDRQCHRCSAHRHRDAVRNDSRLQCCAAGDWRGRDRQRRAQSNLSANDLHTQTLAPRPRRAQQALRYWPMNLHDAKPDSLQSRCALLASGHPTR